MKYSEAKAKRDFIVKNTPAGHKARNITKGIMRGLEHEIEAATPHVYGATTGERIGRADSMSDFDFELDERRSAEIERAYALAVEYSSKEVWK